MTKRKRSSLPADFWPKFMAAVGPSLKSQLEHAVNQPSLIDGLRKHGIVGSDESCLLITKERKP